jgi:hypothetical protein
MTSLAVFFSILLGIAIASLNPPNWFYFPGLRTAEVAKTVAEGRDFLDAYQAGDLPCCLA